MDLPQRDVLDIEEIHVVCLDGDIDVLQSLDVTNYLNTRTANGETPLMLAALFGHVHIVMYLLEMGADVDANDHSGYTAINFASATHPFMSTKRTSYGKSGFTFEKSQKTLYCLRAISELLSVPPTHKIKSNQTATEDVSCFRETLMGVEVYHRTALITTPGRDPRKKTVGYIHTAAYSAPLMFALSGYSKKPTSRATILNGYEWTQVALLIVAPAIGYSFPKYSFDQGWEVGKLDATKSGRFFASHSEVLLATWYCLNLISALKGKPVTRNNKKRLSKYLRDLAHEDLGDARHAIIDLDQKPCESCGLFLEALTKVTRIKFDVVSRRRLMLMPELNKKWPWPMYKKDSRERQEEESETEMSDPQWDTDESHTMERELSYLDIGEHIYQDDADDGWEEFCDNTSNIARVIEGSNKDVGVNSAGTPEEQSPGSRDQDVRTVDESSHMFEDNEMFLPNTEAATRTENVEGLLRGAAEMIPTAAQSGAHFISNPSGYDFLERGKNLKITLQKYYLESTSSGNEADDEDEDFNYAEDKRDPSYIGRRRRKRSLSRVHSEGSLPKIDHYSDNVRRSQIPSSPATPTSAAPSVPSAANDSIITKPSSPGDQIILISSESEQPRKRRCLFGVNKRGDGRGDNGGDRHQFDLSDFLFKDPKSLAVARKGNKKDKDNSQEQWRKF